MSPPISILEAPGDPPTNEISIAQISSGGMALHWYESVAIVQQLCQTLGDLAEHPKFDWSKVFVQPSGDITIRSPGSSDADACVRALGELLRTWLAENPHPVPLGLVVAQATSTPPFYRGATELSEALSHYERPNRIELVRNVYERWRAANPAARAHPEKAPSTPFVAELSRKAGAFGRSLKSRALGLIDFARTAVRRLPRRALRIAVPADDAPRRRFPWKWAAAVTLAIMMAVIAAGVISSGVGRPAATTAGNVLSRADDRLIDAVAARLGAAVNWVGRRFVRMPTGQQTTSPAGPPVRTTRRGASGTSPALPGSPPDVPGDVAPNLPNDASGTADRAVAAPPAQNPVAAALPQPSLEIVYSNADRDVTPPVAIGRQLPDLPPTGVPQSGIALVIVVDQTGRVESATLATRPATLEDAMQATMNLSAAKSWRFRPALRAGQPVKYLRSVWLANR